MKEVLGPWTDIPAPDIGTDERVMAWVFDEFSKHKGFSPAVVTGKVRVTLYLCANLCSTCAVHAIKMANSQRVTQPLYTARCVIWCVHVGGCLTSSASTRDSAPRWPQAR
jgi:glutamate dehydrogenase/leucine dehydrogenase